MQATDTVSTGSPAGNHRPERDPERRAGVHATLLALRDAIADKTRYAREWCTERSGADELEDGRLCLCSRLIRLDADRTVKHATFNALLEYATNRDPWRSRCARLHDVARDHAGAKRLIERALKDWAPRVKAANG